MANEQAPWGRVGDDGTVYVRESDGERAVGSYPDGTPAEALAYFERKFTELQGQVVLLEQRIRGGAPATDIAKAAAALRGSVATANAVGDLASLTTRLDALAGSIGELTQKQTAQAQAAVEAAIADREALVAEAEQLAAADPAKVQWKQTSARLDELFLRWQTAQKDGPRLPKPVADDLWKRFRTARATIDSHRKAFFSELDSVHRLSRGRKQELVDRAEALAGTGAAGIPEYRRLLDDWKNAGRAGKKADDALWARFKAAGDVLYAAKAEVDAREDEEFAGNLELKLALLEEAEQLLTATVPDAAKKTLASVQRRWDAIGKVPRDEVRRVEDRMRKVEAAVRKLEEAHWNATDPEKAARSSGLASQLSTAIDKLEKELAAAKTAGDAKKAHEAEEALAARRIWLDALG